MKNGFGLLSLLLIWLALPVPAVMAQDSARVAAPAKVRFVFNLDARNTFLADAPVRVNGVKAGLEWKNKFRAGLGYYFMRQPMVVQHSSLDQLSDETRLKISYAAVFGEYVLLKNKKWELSLPVQAGFGTLKNQHYNAAGTLLHSETKPLYLVEPSISGHYKVFYWAGIGAGTGYRQVLEPTSRETNNLNAPIYYIKVKLFVGELYRQLRHKHCVPDPALE